MQPLKVTLTALMLSSLLTLAACQAGGINTPASQGFDLRGVSFSFAWSPNRDTVSLVSDIDARPRSTASSASSAVYLFDSHSGKLSQRYKELSQGREQAWSADGKWLEVLPWKQADSTLLMSTKSAERRMIKDPLCSGINGAWSADGSRIACVHASPPGSPDGSAATWQLYVMDLDGKQLKGFDTGLARSSREPGSAADWPGNYHSIRHVRWIGSDRLLFHEVIDITPPQGGRLFGRERYYLADLNGQKAELLYERENFHSVSTEVSPDGKQLLFDDFTRMGELPGQSLLGVQDANPESRVRVLNLTDRSLRDLGAGSHAVWSPDGQQIAALNQDDLDLIPAGGGAPRKLLAKRDLAGRELNNLRWSPDSKELVAIVMRPVLRIPVSTRSEMAFSLLRIQVANGERKEIAPDLSQVYSDAGLP